MIRFGDCHDCRRVDWKAVVCQIKDYSFIPEQPFSIPPDEQDWTFLGRRQPYLTRVFELLGKEYAYTIDPFTGVITKHDPDSRDYSAWDMFFFKRDENPFNDEYEAGLAAVNSINLDDLPWNHGVFIRRDYGVQTISEGNWVNLVSTAPFDRRFTARRTFEWISKIALRIDGKFCVWKRDLTNDIRRPGQIPSGGTIPAPGYLEEVILPLKDCKEKHEIKIEVPGWWGETEVSIEPCVTCPPAPSAVSHAVCYPAP